MWDDLATWYRWFLAVSASLVILLMLWGVRKSFKDLPIALKLFYTGGFCAMIYGADALRESAQTGIGFRWRLIPISFAVIAFAAYVLEPRASLERRKNTMRIASRLYDLHGPMGAPSDPPSPDGQRDH